jgi:hypothetical protein
MAHTVLAFPIGHLRLQAVLLDHVPRGRSGRQHQASHRRSAPASPVRLVRQNLLAAPQRRALVLARMLHPRIPNENGAPLA